MPALKKEIRRFFLGLFLGFALQAHQMQYLSADHAEIADALGEDLKIISVICEICGNLFGSGFPALVHPHPLIGIFSDDIFNKFCKHLGVVHEVFVFVAGDDHWDFREDVHVL